MTPGPGIEPGTHWWEASALTTTPTLHQPCSPKKEERGTRQTRVKENFDVLSGK